MSWFSCGVGIRQGCPRSPLLFALVADPFLRLLRRRVPSAVLRAYADDLVIVVPNIVESLPALSLMLREFGIVSGLCLNFDKVVLVPLDGRSYQVWQQWISTAEPTWSRVTCRGWATYLGFILGPDRADRSWSKPLEKALARARLWGQLALGLQFGAHVYRIFVVPTLSFFAFFGRFCMVFATLFMP